MTEETKKTRIKNRWMVVLAAVVLELALGALYAYSVYQDQFDAQGYPAWQGQLVYSLQVVSFAIMVIYAGKLRAKLGVQKMLLISAILMGGGYVLSAINPLNWVFLLFTLGIVAGIGIGMTYTLPIGIGMKWFPDKKGLVTGLGMAGFGGGSLIWIYAGDAIFAAGLGLNAAFIIYGVCFAAMIMFAYFYLQEAPDGYVPEGYEPPEQEVLETGEVKAEIEIQSKQMIKTQQFWFLFYTFLAGAAAGLMVIGQAKTIPPQFLTDSGMNQSAADAITSFTAAAVYPFFNACGRIGYGALGDKIGWKKSVLLMNGLQVVAMALATTLMSYSAGLIVLMAILALNYGGNFSLMPSATSKLFGEKTLDENYGIVFFAYGVGGLLGPNLGGILQDAGLITVAFVISAVMIAIAVILTYLIKPVDETELDSAEKSE